VIAGNHDWAFQETPALAREALTNAVYLEDCGVEIEGVRFLGSPWTPTFMDWAFMLERGKALCDKWALIPDNTDDHLRNHGFLHEPAPNKGFTAMFRILAPALILALFSQGVKAISDSDKMFQSFLMDELGTLTYQAAGNNKNALLSPEDFQPMGLPNPVSLTEMRNTIQDNEIKAEQQFSGPFATFGHIDRVTRVLGTPAVRLTLAKQDKDWRYGTVTAFFEETDAADLANFEPGNWLTVVCDSWTYSISVGLNGCVLLPTFSKNLLSQPEKTVKRLCSSRPELALFLLSLNKAIETSPSSAVADYNKALWSHSYFRRTGIITGSKQKDMQKVIKDSVFFPKFKAEGKAVAEKAEAGELTTRECLAY
jgi:hypothetical protein